MSRPELPTVLAGLLIAASATPLLAETPARPGDVQTCQVVTLVLNVGSTERDTRRVVYTPPPGWYIRSHRVECTNRYGAASFAVNTVPAGWDFTSEEKASEKAKAKANATVTANGGVSGQAGAATQSARTMAEQSRRSVSHHALVVEAAAQGAGFLRGGAGLELTITADMVYQGE